MFWRPLHQPQRSLSAVYFGAFFLSLHYAITVYIDSTFLAKFFSEQNIGIIFTAGSTLTIFLLSFAPRILRALGNYVTTMIVGVSEVVLLAALPFFQSVEAIALLFVLHTAMVTILLFNFDIFTESRSKDKTTGWTRSVFLTMQNLAVVLGPVIVGAVMTDSEFWKIYLLSAAFMVPVLLTVCISLHNFKDPRYEEIQSETALRDVWKNKDIRYITGANFLLQFFYAIMVIYTPVYLNLHIGFTWGEIGTIFGMMLLPFVLLEIPLGKIADEKLGEKEILVAGFFLIAVTTFSLSFLTARSIPLWAGILFMTRVGAAAIEIMTETYFFKKINARDAGMLGVFRHMRPIAYIVGPLAASVFLMTYSLQYIFIALAIIMFLGLPFSLLIKDTK